MRKMGVFIDADDFELLKKVAKYERLNQSTWVRQVVTQALRRAKPTLPDEGESE